MKYCKPNFIKYFFGIASLIIGLLAINSCKEKQNQLVQNWKVGVSTGIFKDYTQGEFDRVKRNGIKYIEIGPKFTMNKTEEEIEHQVRAFKKKIDKTGIEVWSLHLPYSDTLDISTENEENRHYTIERHKKIMELLKPLKVQKYVIHPSAGDITDNNRSERMKNSIASLKILSEEVKKYDAQLALEDLPETFLGNSSDEMLKIIHAVDNGLEICFDSNHLFQETPEEFVARVGDLITTIHISDYDGIEQKHWLPETGGIINWNNVIQELVNIGYGGPWMYEVSRKGGRERDENYTAKDLAHNWQQLKNEYLKAIDE